MLGKIVKTAIDEKNNWTSDVNLQIRIITTRGMVNLVTAAGALFLCCLGLLLACLFLFVLSMCFPSNM